MSRLDDSQSTKDGLGLVNARVAGGVSLQSSLLSSFLGVKNGPTFTFKTLLTLTCMVVMVLGT